MRYITAVSAETSVDDGERTVNAYLYGGQRIVLSHYQPHGARHTGRYLAVIESQDDVFAEMLVDRLSTGLFGAGWFSTRNDAVRHINDTYDVNLWPLLGAQPMKVVVADADGTVLVNYEVMTDNPEEALSKAYSAEVDKTESIAGVQEVQRA